MSETHDKTGEGPPGSTRSPEGPLPASPSSAAAPAAAAASSAEKPVPAAAAAASVPATPAATPAPAAAPAATPPPAAPARKAPPQPPAPQIPRNPGGAAKLAKAATIVADKEQDPLAGSADLGWNVLNVVLVVGLVTLTAIALYSCFHVVRAMWDML